MARFPARRTFGRHYRTSRQGLTLKLRHDRQLPTRRPAPIGSPVRKEIQMRTRLRRSAILTCVSLVSVAIVIISGGSAVFGAPARQSANVDWNAVQDALGGPGTMMPGD